MQCLARFLLAGWIVCLITTTTFAQEDIEQKIAEQQKLADEAKARQVAGEPAVAAARVKAKELSTAVTTLKIEQNKAEAAIKEGEGTLLDNSMILFGGGISNGNMHNHEHLPIVLGGGGAGQLKGGRHIKYAEPTPLANLHLTLLEKAGVRLDRFADSKGKVAELLEPLSL